MINWIDMIGQAFLGQARHEADAEMGFDGSVGRYASPHLTLIPRDEMAGDRAQAA